MSVDWDKRQGSLGKHKHLSTDVLNEATMETYTGVRLLGPYRVNYNHNWQTVLATLAAGTVVVGVSVFIVTGWSPGNPAEPTLTIAVAPVGNPGGYLQIGQVTAGLVAGNVSSGVRRGAIIDPSDYCPIIVANGGILIADLSTVGQTVGAADIYALIAEPSA